MTTLSRLTLAKTSRVSDHQLTSVCLKVTDQSVTKSTTQSDQSINRVIIKLTSPKPCHNIMHIQGGPKIGTMFVRLNFTKC